MLKSIKGYKKIRFAKPNSAQQTVCKKYSNMGSRSIKVERIMEITKFPSFQFQFGYYSLFCKMGFPLNMAGKAESLDAHNNIFY